MNINPILFAIIFVLILPIPLHDEPITLTTSFEFPLQVTQQQPKNTTPYIQIDTSKQNDYLDSFFHRQSINQQKPHKKPSSAKKYVHTYKDEDGIFRTVVTTEKLTQRMSLGERVYSGSTPQGNLLSKNLNDRRWHNRETKLIKNGNTYLIPAIIGNGGREIQVNLVVDTGCDTTLIYYNQLGGVSPRLLKDIRMRVADGRIVNGKRAKISYIKVGPIQETNFEVNTCSISGSNSNHSGLLGMNFLKDHPFRIDASRDVLVWK